MMRAWLEVDLGALSRNAKELARRARAPLLPMVKSDAYGLGAAAVVSVLEGVSPWGYGVSTPEEGASLRAQGVTRPVLVFTPALPEQFPAMREHALVPSLGDVVRIDQWHRSGGGAWHLSIDTGMSREGVRWNRTAELADVISRHPPDGAYTHFHSAEHDDGSSDEQQRRFRTAVAALPVRPRWLHVENSPAIERQSPSPWDLIRPGVFLYGVGSRSDVRPADVVAFHARIVELRDLLPGDSVSYGATWHATRPSRIATVAAGYADGIRRSLSGHGQALVGGRRVPMTGIVTMDMTMLDVTDVPCELGDVATFLGSQGSERIGLEEMAQASGLSPYELLVGLKLRAPRVYRGR